MTINRLSYQWVCLELGKYQTYEVRPNHKLDSIELNIIPNPSMPSELVAEGYKESNELINAVKEFIDDLMKEHMAVTFEKFPVECFIPCPHCSELHIKLRRFANTDSAFCPSQRRHCDLSELSRYHKMLSTKGKSTLTMATGELNDIEQVVLYSQLGVVAILIPHPPHLIHKVRNCLQLTSYSYLASFV